MAAELDFEAAGHALLMPPGLGRCLSELSPQPIVAVEGSTHVVTYLNPAFARLAGKESKDLLDRPFALAVPEGVGNGCLALLDRVFHSGAPENLAEQEHQSVPSVSPAPVYWSYAVWAILGADEQPVGVMIQVTDATETASFRQQVVAMNEALLVSANRQHELAAAAESLSTRLRAAVQSRDRFLAVLSHELRNPLAAICAGMEFIKLANRDPVKDQNSRAMMERQLRQMVRLVDDLLDVSRIMSGKSSLRKERVDLAVILRDAVEASRPLIALGDHRITVTIPDEPLPLDADPARLAQVFQNLLNNAAKYAEPGGDIRLSVRRDGDELVTGIRDSGIGISAEDLPRIFDVFVQVDTSWQRAQGGMGIGLSLVKEFVELHGGRVEAISDGIGYGSEFIVRLPMAVSPALELNTRPGSTLSASPRRVLIVDDNRDAAESLGMMLGILGHEICTAWDGAGGVAAADEFRPDVILMDIGMPQMDGYEAARRIRAESWGKPMFLIALSGWGAEEDRRKSQEAGFDRHLTKPAEPGTLAELIAKLPTDSIRPRP
ncbi:ATP-binding response regulator [Zavarzinella formosa]|uniref:ATP-binding response regulator n=1 Tax=Zavarzinella formosa TaxID=360055 RepID=UPI0003018B13|nr:ATP-binding protein [Zavarzinella formosa]